MPESTLERLTVSLFGAVPVNRLHVAYVNRMRCGVGKDQRVGSSTAMATEAVEPLTVISSLPGPPEIVSSPPPPNSLSLPVSPFIVSSPSRRTTGRCRSRR